MNPKTAKALRRQANYHPSQPRQYEVINKSRKRGKSGTMELVDSDPRVLYKELKKEYNSY